VIAQNRSFLYFYFLIYYFIFTTPFLLYACQNIDINTYLENFDSTLFNTLCEDLQYQSREKAFIDFLQTSELYYFTQPTEYYTFTLTLENPLFHNTQTIFFFI